VGVCDDDPGPEKVWEITAPVFLDLTVVDRDLKKFGLDFSI